MVRIKQTTEPTHLKTVDLRGEPIGEQAIS